MKDNQEIVILSVIIIMAFAIFVINRIRFKKKRKKKTSNKEVIRKSIVNALADMESNGVYFDRGNLKLPSKSYANKFKQKMKSKA